MGLHIETFTMLSLPSTLATDTLLCLVVKTSVARTECRPQFLTPFSYIKNQRQLEKWLALRCAGKLQGEPRISYGARIW